MTSATGNTSPGAAQYTVEGLTGQLNTSDGGTLGTPQGSLYGFNPNVRILGAVQNANILAGGEIDIGAYTGSTLAKKIGFQIVQSSLDAVSGSTENLGYVLANQAGATGWAVGYAFGNYDGYWPMASTGTMIGCYAHANTGSCGTTALGIDFSNVVFTTDFLKSTGFTVDGSGNEVANAINSTPIGGTTPAAVAATTLSASGAVSGIGFSTYLASPPAIGGTTPAAGSFSTLTVTNTLSAVGVGNGLFGVQKPIVSTGSHVIVASGTGTCATTGTPGGGVQAGNFTCTTAGTAASTVTLTLTATSNGYTCWGRDITTPTTVTQTGALSTSSVTLTLTSVTANDVIQFGCLGY